MMRGRPNMRRQIHDEILKKLATSETPITISTLVREMKTTLKRDVSWNTVKKYLQELIEIGRIHPIKLQHSKEENKSGLTVYTLKK